MSIKKLVSINEALRQVLEDLDENASTMIPTLYRWAIYADSRIRSHYQYTRKTKTVTATDCQILLPLEAVHVVSVLVGDFGCDCAGIFQQYYDMSSTIIASTLNFNDITNVFYWSPANGPVQSTHKYTIRDNCIVFEQNLDEQTFTIDYLAYPEDKDGIPQISEHNVEAVAAYIVWKLSKRERWRLFKTGTATGMTPAMIREFEKEYHRAVREARAQNDRSTDTELQDIKTMLSNPISGYGLYLLPRLR